MCHNNPSLFLLFACHIRLFVSLTLANKCLKWCMIERYHKTLTLRPLFMLYSSTSSSFILNRDTSHLGHLVNVWNSFLYNIQSFGHVCIFWYSISIGHIRLIVKDRQHITLWEHFMQQFKQFVKAYINPPISSLDVK